jgi:hypothetical protein
MIADEINAMSQQMKQLAIVFADVSAAKRVTDTVRKRIEKFLGYLPLLHAVCNPGLRERHWILVRLKYLTTLLNLLNELYREIEIFDKHSQILDWAYGILTSYNNRLVKILNRPCVPNPTLHCLN